MCVCVSWRKAILSYVLRDPWFIIRRTVAPNSGLQLFLRVFHVGGERHPERHLTSKPVIGDHMPNLFSLLCKCIGKGGNNSVRRQRLNTVSQHRSFWPRETQSKNALESRVEKAMPGCRDESSNWKDRCQSVAHSPQISFTFLRWISNLVSDEDFNCQVRFFQYVRFDKNMCVPLRRRPPNGIRMICGWDQDFRTAFFSRDSSGDIPYIYIVYIYIYIEYNPFTKWAPPNSC